MVNNPPTSVFNPGTWTKDMMDDDALTINGKIFRRLLEFGSTPYVRREVFIPNVNEAIPEDVIRIMKKQMNVPESEEISKEHIYAYLRTGDRLREDQRQEHNEIQSRAQSEYYKRQKAYVAERNLNNYKRYGRKW
jgi:hypothetical protein